MPETRDKRDPNTPDPAPTEKEPEEEYDEEEAGEDESADEEYEDEYSDEEYDDEEYEDDYAEEEAELEPVAPEKPPGPKMPAFIEHLQSRKLIGPITYLDFALVILGFITTQIFLKACSG